MRSNRRPTRRPGATARDRALLPGRNRGHPVGKSTNCCRRAPRGLPGRAAALKDLYSIPFPHRPTVRCRTIMAPKVESAAAPLHAYLCDSVFQYRTGRRAITRTVRNRHPYHEISIASPRLQGHIASATAPLPQGNPRQPARQLRPPAVWEPGSIYAHGRAARRQLPVVPEGPQRISPAESQRAATSRSRRQ